MEREPMTRPNRRQPRRRADGSLMTYETELPEWFRGAFDVVIELRPPEDMAGSKVSKVGKVGKDPVRAEGEAE